MTFRRRTATAREAYLAGPFTQEEKRVYRRCWTELVENDLVHPIDTSEVVGYTEALVAAMASERLFRGRIAVGHAVFELPRRSRKWRCLYAFVRHQTVANILREYRKNALRTVELGSRVDELLALLNA